MPHLTVKRVVDGSEMVVEVETNETWLSVLAKLAALTGAASTEGWKLVYKGNLITEPAKQTLPAGDFNVTSKPFVVLMTPKPKPPPAEPAPAAPTPAPAQAAPNTADAQPGVDPDALAQLVGMGFDGATATRALQSAYASAMSVVWLRASSRVPAGRGPGVCILCVYAMLVSPARARSMARNSAHARKKAPKQPACAVPRSGGDVMFAADLLAGGDVPDEMGGEMADEVPVASPTPPAHAPAAQVRRRSFCDGQGEEGGNMFESVAASIQEAIAAGNGNVDAVLQVSPACLRLVCCVGQPHACPPRCHAVFGEPCTRPTLRPSVVPRVLHADRSLRTVHATRAPSCMHAHAHVRAYTRMRACARVRTCAGTNAHARMRARVHACALAYTHSRSRTMRACARVRTRAHGQRAPPSWSSAALCPRRSWSRTTAADSTCRS
jgi:hypothetical protein